MGIDEEMCLVTAGSPWSWRRVESSALRSPTTMNCEFAYRDDVPFQALRTARP